MQTMNKTLWLIVTILIIYNGIKLTLNFNFIQFNIKKLFKILMAKNNSNTGLSTFETLTMSLGGKLGVGSLAGVALCIYYGGSGTIFWMWITVFISAPCVLLESFLGCKYNEKTDDNIYCGGPSYYIKKGLKNKRISKLYSILIIITYIFGFLSIQSNTIVRSITNIKEYNSLIIGIIISVISSIIIIGGVKKIAKFTSFLVPIMSFIYIFACVYIIIINYEKLPNVLLTILNNALNFKSFGFGIVSSLIIGVQRGIFSNEAGIGTGAISSGATNKNNAIKQGILEMLGTYFTTLIICSMTGIVILLSNINLIDYININGIEITGDAFTYFIGDLGNTIIIITIILFAFSTIITGYYYGESNLYFLCKTHKYDKFLKIITSIILIIGSVSSPFILWNIVDIFVAILGIINIVSILFLKKDIISELKHYE